MATTQDEICAAAKRRGLALLSSSDGTGILGLFEMIDGSIYYIHPRYLFTNEECTEPLELDVREQH